MTAARRIVRVSESLLHEVDRTFGTERGPNGEPSRTDVLAYELPSVIDRFANDFDQLPEAIEGIPTARMLIATGFLVLRLVVYGIERGDGSIDLVGISFDLS